ncbi:MAG: M13 family metallopeptidase [Pirellulales bacterium]
MNGLQRSTSSVKVLSPFRTAVEQMRLAGARLASIGLVCVALGSLITVSSVLGANDGSKSDTPTGQDSAVPPAELPVIDFSGFDKSVRPQDDFFRYVNGHWIATTEIPADQGRWGSFMILRDQAAANVRKLVDEISQMENLEPGSDEQKIRDLYRSFMNESRIEELGLQPLREELARIDALQDKAELSEYFGRAARMGVSVPVGVGVAQDAKQPDRYIVIMGQGGLGLPDREYYLETDPQSQELRTKYVDHLSRLLELMEIGKPDQVAAQIMKLETDLAGHHWTKVDNRDREKTYNKRGVKELPEMAPSVGWTPFLDQTGLSDQTELIVRQPSYLQGLSEVLEQTDLETWKNYLKVRLVSQAAGYLSKPFFDADFDFYGKTLTGLEQPEPRWKLGVRLLDGAIGELVGKKYVERHFPPEAKQRMQELVGNLKLAMADSLKNLDWMTETTRQQALLKLSKFTTKIGYPDKWKDYSQLQIDPNDLIGNVWRATEFEHQRDLDKLGGPIDRGEWHMNPQTVNAYYNPSLNEIVFPAAILQPPFFHLTGDDAVNYGAIGAVIGHEIGHGFDDQGRKSDGDGMLRDWWTRQDAMEYEKRAEKLVEQYESYRPLEDLHIDGRLTLGENIGDLGGLTIAHRAYLRSLNGSEPPKIDGLTGEQRFFLGFGQIWRMKSRDEMLRQQIKTDPHSPAPYRVIGVLKNFAPFYEAFKVEPKDGMYLPPDERVSIW